MISTRVRKQQNTNFTFYGKFVAKAVLFLIFLVVLSSLVAKFKTYFPIKTVKVFGAQHVDQAAVQQTLAPLVNKSFFAVDLENIRERLLQSPWVSKAVVQRVWPDQVLITVLEKSPVARWNDSSLLSSGGEVFNPDLKNYSDVLPQFVAPDGQQLRMLQYYKKLSSLVEPLHLKITRLELTSVLSWNVTFDNGVRISVGYKDVLTRVSHFVKVYSKIIGNRVADVEYVDLRYPTGLAVRWKTTT